MRTSITFEVYTTHLKAKEGFSEMRDGQMEQMLKAASNERHPIIITGDWNDTPDSLAV